MSNTRNWYMIDGTGRQALIDLDQVVYTEAARMQNKYTIKLKLKAKNGRGDSIRFVCASSQEMDMLYANLSVAMLSEKPGGR